MSTYNTFNTHVIEHPYQTKKIKLVVFGDIHRDSPCCDEKKWKKFLKKCKTEHDENTYYLCMGDENDFMSDSERTTVCHKLHESTDDRLDRASLDDVNSLADEMEFMRGHMAGVLHGNHVWMYHSGDERGMLSTEVLAKRLDTRCLGYVGYIRIRVSPSRGGTTRSCVDIFASHGKGGGQLLGSPFNTVEKMSKIFPNADIYLMGHDHQRGSLPKTRLEIETGKNGRLRVKERTQHFGRSGSFLMGWVEGRPSYVVRTLYAPSDLGAIKYEIEFARSQRNSTDLIHKEITCIS